MAERENMADATSGPEGQVQLPPGVPKAAAEISQLSWGGKNPLESLRGQLGAPPVENPQRTKSIFDKALDRVDELRRQPPSADRDTALQEATQARDIMLRDAMNNGMLVDVRDVIRGIYTEVTNPNANPNPNVDIDYYPNPNPSSNLRTPNDRIKFVRGALADYQETFWEYGDAELTRRFGNIDAAMRRGQYEGISNYVAARVAIAIEKELKGIPPAPDEFGDFYLEDIKTELAGINAERERRRRELRRRAGPDERLHYNNWRERFDFTWAETQEELKDSLFDWLEKFEQELPDEAPEKVDEAVREGRRNALSALKQAENRLGIRIGSILDKEFRATIEGYVDPIGGVRLLESEGGFDAYTAYLEDFAYNFNAHHDAIMLGNEKSAIIQDFLSENDGAIALGSDGTIEKPQEGDILDFRGTIEWRAKIYAATHELYIRETDFEAAKVPGGDNKRYVWGEQDLIQELLLSDARDMANAQALTDPAAREEAIAKVQARIGVFKRIKERLDGEDRYGNVNLADLTVDQRKNVIRIRIRQKIQQEGNRVLLQEIGALPDQDAKDKALWKWVKEFNELREKYGAETWFPSYWDTVRLSIDRPTKLIDRVLSKNAPALDENGNIRRDANHNIITINELKAMVEEVKYQHANLPEDLLRELPSLTDNQIRDRINALPNLSDGQKKETWDDVLFDRQSRMLEAVRAFNINMTYMEFLGVQARWGGQVVRVLDENGNMVLKTVSSLARDILKAKIDKEERDIEVEVNQFANQLPAGLTAQQIEEAKTNQRRLLRRDATFGATLALREIGIANDLPIWNYYYYNDPERIQAFAPLVGLTHERKPEIVELLDRGRRETRAVFDYLAEAYMDGRILTVVDDPLTGQHEEHWDRSRVINQAGELALRDVFDSRFMLSTSGAIKVVPLISKIGDLGVYDLLWEMGCWDFQEFQGFIKRRDEVELRKQSFWNTTKWRDPITYAQRLRGAKAAIPFLRGGEVKGQGYKPGVLQEPLMGAWRVRTEVTDQNKYIDNDTRKIIGGEGGTLPQGMTQSTIEGMAAYRVKLLEVLGREGIVDHLGPNAKDRLVEIGAGIMVTLIDYMNSRRYVMNRAGFAPKNWEADDELIFQAWAEEVGKRSPLIAEAGEILAGGKIASGGEIKATHGAEPLGSKHLAYSPEGRSVLAIQIYTVILRESSYHIFDNAEREAMTKKANKIKAELDTKREQLAAQPLSAEVQARINARIAKLQAKHTSQENLVKEKQRLKDHYIDEQLHNEFVPEWPARFAEYNPYK